MTGNLSRNGVRIRKAVPKDHARVVSVMVEWWDGRDLRTMLPRLFFEHFTDTIYIAETETVLAGFAVCLMSQARADEGYIHFAGVHPDFRHMGIGGHLYGLFFKDCLKAGRHIVRSCTSPVNTGSIAFHTKMGFEIEPGDATVDGCAVTLNYNRPEDPKVLFRKILF